MSTGNKRLLKCPVCDTVVEVLAECGLEIVCCGPSMVPVSENVVQDSQGEHQPVVKWTSRMVDVRMDAGHPMDEDHYIAWIEVVADGKSYRQFFGPDQQARATFAVQAKQITVRAYCNVHGLWKCVPTPRCAIPARFVARGDSYCRAAV